MSLTSPLGLMRHVRRPNLRLEVVPWLNVLALGWMLSLLGSSYIYAPGLAMGLTPNQSLPAHLSLPESASQPTLQHIDTTLTIMLPYYYLDDGRHFLTDLPKALHNFVVSAKRNHLVLLVKMNSTVSVQILDTVSDMAIKAGFETVQLAVVPSGESDFSLPAIAPASETKNP